jgi:Holliday junction resolvasome RuvABC endonuclease subunit
MKRGVIGIDPSLGTPAKGGTGICGVNGDSFTVRPKLADDTRLTLICDAVRIQAEVADLAVIEDLPTNAMSAGKTGMAQGVVRFALQDVLTPYVLVPPATLKVFATGRGNADKSDMRMELFKRAGLDLRDDNQVDAWWLRQLGLHWMGIGSIPLPALHTRALDKVDFSHLPEGIKP